MVEPRCDWTLDEIEEVIDQRLEQLTNPWHRVVYLAGLLSASVLDRTDDLICRHIASRMLEDVARNDSLL